MTLPQAPAPNVALRLSTIRLAAVSLASSSWPSAVSSRPPSRPVRLAVGLGPVLLLPWRPGSPQTALPGSTRFYRSSSPSPLSSSRLTRRAADSRRFAPLAAVAAVSCATVEMSVTHPAPSPTGHVPGASTQGPRPTLQPSAQSVSSTSSAAPGFDRVTPHHFVPGHLVLAHLARTRSCVLGLHSRSPVTGVTTHICAAALRPCQSTGVIEMLSITAHRLRGTASSPTSPANTTGASVAGPWPRPHSGAMAASTRTANPACSRLAQLRCARS